MRSGYAASNGLTGQNGVRYSPRAFFPLFPALAEPFYRWLSLGPGTALVLVSAAAGLAAAGGIYACAAHCHGHRAGIVAVVLWGALPLAAIENLGYSEALFTALVAWALYAVLSRRWLSAGALCVLAGLTRPTAMVLSAAVMLAALVELYRWRRDRGGSVHWWRPLAAGVLAPLGWGGYLLWTGWVEGSWGAYFRIQQAWGTGFDGGVSLVRRLVHLVAGTANPATPPSHAPAALPSHAPTVAAHIPAATGIPLGAVTGVVMVVTVVAYIVLFVVTVRRRQPLVLVLYSAALLVLDLGNSSPVPPLARFLLPGFAVLFPLAELLARIRSRWLLVTCLGTAALLSAGYGIIVVFAGDAPA